MLWVSRSLAAAPPGPEAPAEVVARSEPARSTRLRRPSVDWWGQNDQGEFHAAVQNRHMLLFLLYVGLNDRTAGGTEIGRHK